MFVKEDAVDDGGANECESIYDGNCNGGKSPSYEPSCKYGTPAPKELLERIRNASPSATTTLTSSSPSTIEI